MLKLLRISNIALISSLDMDFGPGLTLLTGETGAGKSILIDSLGLLLGGRGSVDLIRTGEEVAVVEGAFESSMARALLDAHGLPSDGDEIVVRREFNVTGKSKATLNGALVPLTVLRQIAPQLAVIHGQNEPLELLDPGSHLEVVDRHGGLLAEAKGVYERYGEWARAGAALDSFRLEARELERRRDTLEYQVAEIRKSELKPGEEEALRQEKTRQANAGRLASLASEAFSLLYEDESAVLTRLSQVYRRVEELATMDPRFNAHLEPKDAVRAQIEDLALFLRDYQDSLTVSPGRLDEIEARLVVLERLKKKYGATLEDVSRFGETCQDELKRLSSPEEQERRLQAEWTEAAHRFRTAATALSSKRRKAARDLETKIRSELAQLAMEKTRFAVRFDPEDPDAHLESLWSERGLEKGQFLLSPNPGEELRPLDRIASGGELSRILLALRSVAGVEATGRTLVFDEVDAGIGGRVAEVVGKKLKALAQRDQVLCVTHLPQIASLANKHYAVQKSIERGRTLTSVRALSSEDRVDEVARMLGGETITDAARRHAREMVKQGFRA